jgi:hypothetical protein
MVIDSGLLRKNCEDFAKAHRKAKDVLKLANGKRHYKAIANDLGIPDTTVSGLLSKASKLGLAKKLENGCYKKESSIMGYMPTSSNIKEPIGVPIQSIASKIKKRKVHQTADAKLLSKKVTQTLPKMLKAYEFLYVVENSLRELIRDVLSNEENWWETCIPKGIQTDVQETINKTPYHAAERGDLLEYTHLGQLKEIIISKKNWNNFLPHLNEHNKQVFSVTIDRAISSRNAIGHCIPLKTNDLKVVELRFNDILKMLT